MKSWLKQSQTLVGLSRDLRAIRDAHLRGQRSAIQDYLAKSSSPKLQIGASNGSLPGWLSTDIRPSGEEVIYLDATKPFPFPSASFDYIHCEHMIEHISQRDGLNMLKECRRVLKPGGVLRLATPDLAFILGLYQNASEDQKKYVEWVTAKFLPEQTEAKASLVINNAFRAWGHQFIYDAENLEQALRKAGFTEIVREKYNQSRHEPLRGIEKHGLNVGNEQMAICESLVFEAA